MYFIIWVTLPGILGNSVGAIISEFPQNIQSDILVNNIGKCKVDDNIVRYILVWLNNCTHLQYKPNI